MTSYAPDWRTVADMIARDNKLNKVDREAVMQMADLASVIAFASEEAKQETADTFIEFMNHFEVMEKERDEASGTIAEQPGR